MLYLANPCSPRVVEAMTAGLLGYIDTPAQGNKRPTGVTWCADNGCFSDKFDEDKWWTFLEKNAGDAATCLFATAPDVVGDAEATLIRSRPWLSKIRGLGYPAAFCVQNGQERVPVPWAELDCLFIGGSPECVPCGYVRPKDAPRLKRGERPRCPHCGEYAKEWKEGPVAQQLIREAKALGKWVHCGRVNGDDRYQLMRHLGVDSCDGTYLVFGPDVNLPKLLRWGAQGDLFVEAS